MLVDEVQIIIKAGDGGDGKVSFRREKFVPKGGPDGGKGGNGGDFYIVGVSDIGALSRYRTQKRFEAEKGEMGGADNRTGACGQDMTIKVPTGTVIKDVRSGEMWEVGDLRDMGKPILIAKGGKGGWGNIHYKSATHQTPLEYQEGTPGEERELFMELRLIADIGIIGLPSAGKSSLLNELTNAGVKVAAYHFTTLEPNLGEMDGLILADLPGLIEGASSGKGLGTRFLKHIKRTKVLIHCLSTESQDPIADYEIIRKELGEYDKELLDKPEIILFTKSDLVTKDVLKKKISTFVKTTVDKKNFKDILSISIYDLDGLLELKKKLFKYAKDN